MPKSPTSKLTRQERVAVGDAWFFWLSPLNAAYARTRPGPKRDDIAKTYFEIVEAVGFGGRAKIQRTPREATT